MRPLFLQTSDPYHYSEILSWTSRSVRDFCRRQNIGYEAYVGIKKGRFPWQATFNRIYIFTELIERGFDGWVVYLDADAWIADLNFQIDQYLDSKNQYAAIFTPSGATAYSWDVNAGVMFLNLAHPVGQKIAHEWLYRFNNIWSEVENLATFPEGGPDDQSLLHLIVKDRSVKRHICMESRDLMNSSHASFIRQRLRSEERDFSSRVNYIKAEIKTLYKDSLPVIINLPKSNAISDPTQLADRARDKRDWRKAAIEYSRALRLDPYRAPIWVQLGHALKEQGDLRDGEEAYRRALAIDEANADTHLQLGHILKLQGKITAAAEAYFTALTHDDRQEDCYNELKYLGYDRGEVSAALTGGALPRWRFRREQ